MEPKHTPKPWRVAGQNIYGNEQNGYICTWSGRLADAHLIAAAPDLLEACKDVICAVKRKEPLGGIVFQQAIDNVKAAVAKAEGEERTA